MSALPVLTTPVYNISLVSQRGPIEFRPYLVKEEKLLMIAQQSEDEAEIEAAVRQIIQNCTFGRLNVDVLPTFDIEYLFLQLRAKSVNNLVELRYQCNNKPDGQTLCHTMVTVSVNLDDVKITVPPEHTNKIMLSEAIGVTFKYPTIRNYATVLQDAPNVTQLIRSCLDTIFLTDGTVHELSEAAPAEVDAFVDTLTLKQIDQLKVFFTSMPRLEHQILFTCPKCQFTETIVLRGLMDFFD